MEGRQAVRELLVAGRRPVREIWIAAGLDPSKQLDEIERLGVQRRTRVNVVPRGRLERAARTESHQGVIAWAREIEEADLGSLVSPSGDHVTPLLLVLDGVTDPHNLGALLRTASCAGITGVVLARHRSAHVTPSAAKAAAGAIEHVPIALAPGIPAALAQMERSGMFTIGLDATADRSIYDLGTELAGPAAIVLGSEGSGLPPLTKRRCSVLASIPLAGAIRSLNVAAAGAIACFEVCRRRTSSN